MSAYLVTDTTIDVIVAAAHKYRVSRKAASDLLGQAIKLQNLHALHVRYPNQPESASAPTFADVAIDAPYTYTEFDRLLKREVIARAIKTWEYQCSEFTGVEDTAVSRLVTEVKERNDSRLLDRDPDFDFDTVEVHDISDRDECMVAPRPEPVLATVAPLADDYDEDDEDDDFGDDLG